jgi:DNA primase
MANLNIWGYKSAVLEVALFDDILKDYGFNFERVDSGNFTHKCRCIFHNGKEGGREKTPSLFFSDKTKSFFCFACHSTGNIIDFVHRAEGIPAEMALKKLANYYKVMDKEGNWKQEVKFENKQYITFDKFKTVEPYVLEVSIALNDYIKKFIGTEDFKKEFSWFERFSKRVDEKFFNLGYEDWEEAKRLSQNALKAIKKRGDK